MRYNVTQCNTVQYYNTIQNNSIQHKKYNATQNSCHGEKLKIRRFWYLAVQRSTDFPALCFHLFDWRRHCDRLKCKSTEHKKPTNETVLHVCQVSCALLGVKVKNLGQVIIMMKIWTCAKPHRIRFWGLASQMPGEKQIISYSYV